uniref:Alkylglycerol monooxygenase n=1 Tax=Timema californicum TaxID=61474 RepID=A0A7R9J061_TIMCA|nr:unnamed protein product [Timema californicum]
MLINETLNVGFGADSSRDILRGLAQMFYMVSPQETTFEEPEEVPKYFRQAWPYFLAFLVVENVLLWMEEKTLIRFNDGITSLSHGVFLECGSHDQSIDHGGERRRAWQVDCYCDTCHDDLAGLSVDLCCLSRVSTEEDFFSTGIRKVLTLDQSSDPNLPIIDGPDYSESDALDKATSKTCHSVEHSLDSSTSEDGEIEVRISVGLVFRGAENVAYIFIYENFRLVELPWDSAWTWYLAVVGVDFCYYWLHRACHEVHILWAQHQVHHSSEEFNLTVGLRQSILQGWCGFLFYLPLAVIIPPAHFLTHQQFNLLFQFWIHTKSVHTLGPLEWVFNTPRHHRLSSHASHCPDLICSPLRHARRTCVASRVLVGKLVVLKGASLRAERLVWTGLLLSRSELHKHHGRQRRSTSRCNLYCLDKNYGGLLIIWDRLFGTFADERPKEEIIYGLVYNQPSFNPFFLQIFYNMNVINKWKSMSNWQDKLAAVWKGPSWIPGKPRLGAEEDKLDIKSRDKYNVQLPLWCNLYLLIHFVVVVIGFQELALRYMGMSPLAVLGFVAYILTSLTTIGMLFDNHPYACLFELVRCLAFVCALYVSSTHINTKHCSSFKLDEKTRMKTRSAMGIQLACPQVVDAAQALKLG